MRTTNRHVGYYTGALRKKTIRKFLYFVLLVVQSGCGGLRMSKHDGGGAVYGVGFIGALVYYIQQASGIGEGLLGIVKALVWPAFVVHGLLGFLGQ